MFYGRIHDRDLPARRQPLFWVILTITRTRQRGIASISLSSLLESVTSLLLHRVSALLNVSCSSSMPMWSRLENPIRLHSNPLSTQTVMNTTATSRSTFPGPSQGHNQPQPGGNGSVDPAATNNNVKASAGDSYFVDAKKGEVNELRTLLRTFSLEKTLTRKREIIKKGEWVGFRASEATN